MAYNQTFMDVPAIRNISKRFSQCSEILTRVAKTLDTLAATLRTSAFTGKPGRRAAVLHLERIGLSIKNLADQCNTMAVDIHAAAEAFERGDQEGATRYY